MHEMSLINNLLHKIESIAKEQKADHITSVRVRLGALSHISADHFKGHFIDGVKGTIAEGALLNIEVSDDLHDPQAQDIMLLSVAVEKI